MSKKKIKKVSIIPGCISCGTCEAICPQVFEVKDISYVKKDAPFDEYAEEIEESAEMCPVSVIKVEKSKIEESDE